MLSKGKRRAILLAVADALIVIFSAVLSIKLRFNFYAVPEMFSDPL